jgi:replicative DNA helicase
MTDEIKKENIIDSGRGGVPEFISTAPPSITPEKMLSDLAELKKDLDADINESHNRIRLASYDGEDKIITSYQAQELINKLPEPELIKLDMPKFDEFFGGGLDAGRVIAVSGYVKSGKTTLIKTFCYNYSFQKINCLFFSFEMGMREFIKKFPRLPLFLLPQKNINTKNMINWIRDKIIEAKYKHDNVKVIFIDHLHFLFRMLDEGNVSLIIGQICRDLKSLAIEEEIIIYIICHVFKSDPTLPPEIHMIRDSGMIAAEADAVIMTRRNGVFDRVTKEFEYGETTDAFIRANRITGVCGKINMKYSDGLFIEQ